MQQMAHFIQAEPARLRQTQHGKLMNGIGHLSTLTADADRFRQDADSFAIADRGDWRTSFRCQFADSHAAFPLT